MDSRRDRIKLGVFMMSALAVGVGVLIYLVGVNLQQEEDRYMIRYEQSVTGLQSGSLVTLNGVRVGEVREMSINPNNVEQIQITIGLTPGTPVKTDTRAYLLSQGITGLKYIDLQESTKKAKRLEPGSEIMAGKGLIDKLSDRADTLSATADDIVRNLAYITREDNRRRIDEILVKVDKAVANANMLMEEATKTLIVARGILERNEASIDATIAGVGSASVEFRGVLREARLALAQGRETAKKAEIDALIRGFNETNVTLRSKIEQIEVTALVSAVATLQQLIVELTRSLSQNQEQLRVMMFNLRQTTDNVKDLSRTLKDQPSRLIFDEKPKERDLP